MAAELRYFWALLCMSFKSLAAQRSALIVRTCLTLVNHCVYFPVWYIIFSLSPDIMGWTMQHALFTYALCIISLGAVSLIAFGLRTIPEQIDHGEFDAYLTLPRPVLISVALSSPKNSGFGEIVLGLGMLIFCHIYYGSSLLFLPLLIIIGCVIFASSVLFFATLGFWIKQFYASADEIYFNFNLLATRPAPIFTGMLQFIALTLVPVSLMARVSVDYVMSNHLILLFYAVIGAAAYAFIAVSFFHIGLRHYESGSRFGVRG